MPTKVILDDCYSDFVKYETAADIPTYTFFTGSVASDCNDDLISLYYKSYEIVVRLGDRADGWYGDSCLRRVKVKNVRILDHVKISF